MDYYGNQYIAEANDDFLLHYGVGPDDNPPGRGSGRYAKGTGENPLQHDIGLAGRVKRLKSQGISESDIAKGLGFKSTVELRQSLSIEANQRKGMLTKKVPELNQSGMSVKEISDHLGISQSSVRNYLNTDRKIQLNRTNNVADRLKVELADKHYIDVGPGVELSVNCSSVRLKTALKSLEDEGYKIHKVNVPQMGAKDQFTTVTVLGDKDTEWKTVVNDPSLIKPFESYFENDGDTGRGLVRPKSIDSSRVYINYTDEATGKGGAEKDGLVEIRRGVEDISLGKSSYSQVRIGVDDKYYMKGMACYSDNVPDGYDIIYNTNKKTGTAPEKVFKPMKTDKDGNIDWTNPFGATIKDGIEDGLKPGGQRYYIDENGEKQLSVINKVNDQGDWAGWSKTVSSQILSKQPTTLVKKQLEETYKDKEAEYNEIISLTNPTVKRKLLESFAEDMDASAAHLKAKAFPGQSYYTIMPVPSLKGDDNYIKQSGGKIDGEVYAPRYENGETLALFRSPHASISEIPIVKVNNSNKEAKAMLGNAGDAIGINANIAQKLSGADFDGDTVIAVPLKSTDIKSKPQLKELKNFNTKDYAFADPDGADKDKIISSQEKQKQMGMITNLITDMSFRDGVTDDEMARAIKHSMVIIDSEKHKLDYKQSAIDNNIQQLKDKYQQGHGAGTIISRAGAEIYINKRKAGTLIDEKTGEKYYGIDPRTGEKIWEDTGKTKVVKNPTKKDPNRTKEVLVQEKVHQMDMKKDARDLMSSKDNPHPTELVYANYANQLKDLANQARKELVSTERLKRDPEATKKYAAEVESLNAKLVRARSNAPKERIAQVMAYSNYKNALKTNPSLENDKDHLKRLRGQFLTGARNRVGAKKEKINITDKEWEAIQNRAVSETTLMSILRNADDDQVRKLATPRRSTNLSPAIQAGIKAMANRTNGPTLQQIAEQYGVSASTVSAIVNG